MSTYTEKSHYVPAFLLKSWACNVVREGSGDQNLIRGYSWRKEAEKVISSIKGAKGFCHTRAYVMGAQTPFSEDVIERRLFDPLDSKAAGVIRKIRASTYFEAPYKNFLPQSSFIANLNAEERTDIVKFILSLLSRNPWELHDLVHGRVKEHENMINDNEELKKELRSAGISCSPLEWANRNGMSVQTMALFRSNAQINNRRVGEPIIRRPWTKIRFPPQIGSLFLSDCPVWLDGRTEGIDTTFMLPLSPQELLIIWGSASTYHRYAHLSASEFLMMANYQSAQRILRYLFCVDATHEKWIETFLKSARGYPDGQK